MKRKHDIYIIYMYSERKQCENESNNVKMKIWNV